MFCHRRCTSQAPLGIRCQLHIASGSANHSEPDASPSPADEPSSQLLKLVRSQFENAIDAAERGSLFTIKKSNFTSTAATARMNCSRAFSPLNFT